VCVERERTREREREREREEDVDAAHHLQVAVYGFVSA